MGSSPPLLSLPLVGLTEADRDSSALLRIDEARLRRLHEQAAQRQFKCLDTLWRGMGALYHFQCPQGHHWKRNALNPETLSCPLCNPPPSAPVTPLKRVRMGPDNRLKEGLVRLQRMAAERGGQCLSEQYSGSAKYHRFRCAQGHEWETKAISITQGRWCPHCARLQKSQALRQRAQENGWARLQQMAQSKGGQCLSHTYFGADAYYRFRCANGHEWETRGHAILSDRWCSRCANERRRLTLKDAQAAADQRGGQCLSDTYAGASAKMTWACQHGHVWEATLTAVRQGSWCPQCARRDRLQNKRAPRPRIREIAPQRDSEPDVRVE